MGPILVVPTENRRQLVSHGSAPKGNAWQCLQDLLGGEDDALHDGDAALLADCPEAWSDVMTPAPAAVGLTGQKLRALVADQVPWRQADDVNGAPQELSYLDGVWLVIENRKALDAA